MYFVKAQSAAEIGSEGSALEAIYCLSPYCLRLMCWQYLIMG